MAMKPKMPPARFAKKSAPTNERKNVQKITEEGRPKKVAPSRGERGKSDVSGKGSDAKREAPPKAEKKRSQKITEEGKPGKVRAVKAGAAGKAITNKPDIAEHGQSDVPDMLHGKRSFRRSSYSAACFSVWRFRLPLRAQTTGPWRRAAHTRQMVSLAAGVDTASR